jgi:hypothetical protein
MLPRHVRLPRQDQILVGKVLILFLNGAYTKSRQTWTDTRTCLWHTLDLDGSIKSPRFEVRLCNYFVRTRHGSEVDSPPC